MPACRFLGVMCVGLFVSFVASPAQAGQPCPWWRPCGPGGCINKVVPQGAFGADFRPACQRHDDCYNSGACDRAACDRQFYQDMCSACECSRRPALCRCRAKCYYMAARMFGDCYYNKGTCDDQIGKWECFTSAGCCESNGCAH